MRNENFVNFANSIQSGEKITLVKFTEFGFPYSLQTVIHSAEIKPYAQYEETLQIVHKEKRKRTAYRLTIKPNDKLIIWKGWHDVNTEMYQSKETNINGVTVSKSLTCFNNDYMENAINSVNVKPILTNKIYTDKDIKELNTNDYIYQIVSSSGIEYYTYRELHDQFKITGYNNNRSNRLELQKQPLLCGHSPMWNGYEDNKGVIRYETNRKLTELMA